jgi:uncharacterized membrane protein YhaH (DUF805 family)
MEYMFLPLKRYADFSGRSRRMEYWMFVLFQILLGALFWVAMTIVGGAALMGGGSADSLVAAGGAVMVLVALYGLVSLALIIPALAVGVRRLHDTNRSGWWILAPLAPYCLSFIGISMGSSGDGGSASILVMLGGVLALVMAIVLLVFMLLDGTPGANRYGEEPTGGPLGEVFALISWVGGGALNLRGASTRLSLWARSSAPSPSRSAEA